MAASTIIDSTVAKKLSEKSALMKTSADGVEIITEQQRKVIYKTLVEIGKKLPTSVKRTGGQKQSAKQQQQQTTMINRVGQIIESDGSFDRAACVLVINCIKVNKLIIITAIAAEIIDIDSGDVLQSKAWKILQKMPPQTAATKAGIEMSVMRDLVLQHETQCGYYFVDRSPITFTFNTVIHAVNRMAAICGIGCYSYEADLFAGEHIFDFEIMRIPVRNQNSIARTPDIVHDVSEHAKLVANSLRTLSATATAAASKPSSVNVSPSPSSAVPTQKP